jgi:RimJ/RimL family protein N-acetyltransferase
MQKRSRGPAYRIHTPRLVVRCWDPADAPKLKEAIDASLEHLKRWMPWAKDEPTGVEAKTDLLRSFRGEFDLDSDFTYGFFDRDESLALGGGGLHTRIGADALEIGYWIRASHEGRGLVTEAVAALVRVAFEVERVSRVEIHCDPENARSAAVARRLGLTHEATLRARDRTPDGAPRDTMIWSMFADGYPSSPAASAKLEAFDAGGARLHFGPR